jgi:alpha-L-fucosidase 2
MGLPDQPLDRRRFLTAAALTAGAVTFSGLPSGRAGAEEGSAGVRP